MKESTDILFVVNDFTFLKSHRMNLLKKLSSKGLIISIATDLSSCSESELVVLKKNFHQLVDFRDNRTSINPISNLVSVFRLLKVIKLLKPRALSLVSPKPIIFGGLASFLYKVDKVFFTISGMGYVFIDKSMKAFLLQKVVFVIYRLIFARKNCTVIFQNRDDRDLFLSEKLVDPRRTMIIQGNGINTSLFKRKNFLLEPITFLFASRLLLDKGIMEFVRAAESISPGKAIFKVAGGVDRSNPNSITEPQLELIKESVNIDYLGKIKYEYMSEVFQSSNIFVLPSYREGLPQVALEAASCSMPLILSDVNGCRDCVLPNKTGLLVKERNWMELRDAFNYFINNSSKIETMGISSRQHIKNFFSEDIIHKQFLELYRSF